MNEKSKDDLKALLDEVTQNNIQANDTSERELNEDINVSKLPKRNEIYPRSKTGLSFRIKSHTFRFIFISALIIISFVSCFIFFNESIGELFGYIQ